MDWRAGVRRALASADAGPRFAVCYAGAAALALFFADELGVTNAYWATLTTIMVMRREGTASLTLVIHYMAGTLIGIPIAYVLYHAIEQPVAVALLATAAAAGSRVGLALNPAIGFAAFTVFFLLIIDLALSHSGAPPHLLSVRLYDVTVGCVLALIGTVVASLGARRTPGTLGTRPPSRTDLPRHRWPNGDCRIENTPINLAARRAAARGSAAPAPAASSASARS